MWLYVVLGLLAVLAGLAVFAATRPAEFRVERSATMGAPPAALFPHVNDLPKWRAWSPWEDKDPDMQRTYEGPTAGEGATYSWAGDKNVGEGRMTIVESRPNEFIRISLEFFKPFRATNESDFSFHPAGDQTTVVWGMTGTRNFMMKVMSIFMDMDKMVGPDFEKGLVRLKTVVESPGG